MIKGRLYTPPSPPSLRSLGYRLLFVFGLVFAAILIIYFERGLKDSQTGEHPDFLSCVYYAIITITTVGYGDIVPVNPSSRLVDAILLTPIRFIVLATFFGTAYQLTYQRFQEGFRMAKAVEKFKDHIVVCGYGATGQEAVCELLLQGHSPDQIAVIDTEEAALEGTADLGVVAVVGDAAREGVLLSVAVDRAAHVLVCPGRDDAAVLIALTARDHNTRAHITAACRRKENVKLLKRAGAETIITPAAAGGKLMAAATRKRHLAETLRDMLSMGGALQVHERSVEADEMGRKPGELSGIAVVRVYRDGKTHNPDQFPTLQAGDTIIYVATGNGE